MRVAVTGAGRPARAGRSSRRWTTRRSPGLAGPIAWTARDFDLDAPDGHRALVDRDRPEVDRPLRRLDRRRRLRPRPRAGAAAQRRRDRRPRRGLRRGGHRPDRGLDERGLRRPPDRRPRLRAGRRAEPDQPLRREQAGRRAAAAGRVRRARRRRQLAIARTAWLFGPGQARLPEKILAAAERGRGRRRAAPRRRRRVGLPDLHRRRRRRDRRAARRRARSAGIHHLVNGLLATRARLGARRRRRAPGSTSSSRTSRLRPGRAPSTPPRWGVLEPTPLPSGEPLRPWPRRDGRLRADAAARLAASRRGRPAAREPRSGAVDPRRRPLRRRRSASATSAARSASCGGASRQPSTRPRSVPARPTPRSCRPTCRPRPPACCAGCTTTAGSWITGSSLRAGRSWRSSMSGRSSTGGPGHRRDARAGADDWVVIPTGVAHGFLALEPLELLYLVTNEYDGSDELGFAWDDPAVGVPWPVSRGHLTAGRSSRDAIRRTRRWRSSSRRLAGDFDQPLSGVPGGSAIPEIPRPRLDGFGPVPPFGAGLDLTGRDIIPDPCRNPPEVPSGQAPAGPWGHASSGPCRH